MTQTSSTTGHGILSESSAQARAEVVALLTKAYWMEMETVMSYVASSINPDGVRAEEIKRSLAEDVQEDADDRGGPKVDFDPDDPGSSTVHL